MNYELEIVSTLKNWKTTFRTSDYLTNRLSIYPTILIFLFSCGIIGIGYFTERPNFTQLFGIYSILFIAYYFLQKNIQKPTLIISLGIFFRLLLLFSTPALSDDFYRFIWDGQLLINHLNPYTILPSEFIQNIDYQQIISNSTIFQKLNSPNYYTVYPSLNQYIFGIASWFANGSIIKNIVILRLFILVGEAFTLYLLHLISQTRKLPIGLYAFNPLIIIELTGNVHFEGIVITFLILAYYLYQKNQFVFSTIAFACAVSTKLLPLIFIPLIIKHLGVKKGLKYSFWVGLVCVLFFTPFVDNLLITRISSSISLYFQKFEFNASIYYLTRTVGYWFFGYNIIAVAGKAIILLSFAGILWLSAKSTNFFKSALLILSLYLALATTVHPWYASTLVAITIFTNFRYPIVWSLSIFLSYAAYQSSAYTENLFLVFLEYAIVYGYFMYEYPKQNKPNISKTSV